ncbi:MAG: peptidyl-prolyl cis-trans isomerase [Balneolales bacterium]
MHYALFLSSSILFLLISCTSTESDSGNHLLAEVQGEKLTLDEVRGSVPEYIYEQDSLKAIRNYRMAWVNRQVLLQEAKRLGLDANEGVQERVRRAEEEVLASALHDLVQKEIRENGVTRQEAQIYYENHRDQFSLKERHVRYRHLIAETMSSAQNAKNSLMRGNEWEDVARRYSINAEQVIQNSNRFWPLSTAAADYPDMNDFLQVIGLTEISPISEINGRYHFVQLLEDRSEGEHPDLEWVLGQIEEWLLIEKQRRNSTSYERNLFLKADSNNEIKLYDVHNLEQSKEIPLNLESDTITSY